MKKPLDPMRCKAWVRLDTRMFYQRQCHRAPIVDGFCYQHHPDSVARRRAESKAKWEKRLAADTANYERPERIRKDRDALLVCVKDLLAVIMTLGGSVKEQFPTILKRAYALRDKDRSNE